MKKINKKYILIIFILIILLYNVSYQIFKINIPFVVDTDSMKKDINKYDILILKKSNYNINDIIVFKYNNQLRIAKIYNIKQDFYTVKTNQNLYYYDDIKNDVILGKNILKIPYLGIIFIIIRSQIITFILLTFFIILFIINEKSNLKNKVGTI